MDWNDVRLIVEIGRTGSFAGASVALGASKPTISRRVASLERYAGVRLFKRTPHGALLTDAGRDLILRATKIEENVLDFERVLTSLKLSPSPIVSISMSEGVASYLVTPVLAKKDLGPLGISAKAGQMELPPIRMATLGPNERADISLRWTPVGQTPSGKPSDKASKLADISFVPFYSATYGSHRHLPRHFDTLSDHRLITLGAYEWFSDAGWGDWHRMLRHQKKESSISAEWSSAVGHLTLAGTGIGLLPTYAPMYSAGMLRLPVDTPPMFASLWMMCSDDAYRDATVRRCFNVLNRMFREADWMRDA